MDITAIVGILIALYLSDKNENGILMMLFHSLILGWIYVLYYIVFYVIFGTKENTKV